MSEILAGWLLFTRDPARQFGELTRVLRNDDWTVPQRGDEYRYSSDDDLRYVETFDEVVEDLNAAVSAWIKLERDQTEIVVEKNADNSYVTPELTDFHIWAWDTEFESPRDGWNGRSRKASTRTYVQTVRKLTAELDPEYGYAKYPEYVNPATMPTYDDVLDGRIRGAFWLNVVAPKYIETIGRDRIESAPAWLVEELTTGHFLVVASDNPVRPSDQWDGAIGALAAHLDVPRG